ncbi:hypothetical protein FHX74_000564 [Friedmanniella endophytica]|uniref:Anti-sigma factor n=1 Tax=Microlunatus kandeliicorticis TaxID=1759536 RepID=A0A7W3IPR2_9ACTN|nr:hypothetical protein [Microlunatus kandeliicorticis]MBA8792970.1 hypothetical protein [Microlunatus kandeliicorticis]
MHTDPDLLSLAALGEPLEPDDHAHLVGCAECRDQLAGLQRVVELGREAGLERLQEPPAHLWDRIRDELGLSVAPERGADAFPPPPAPASATGRTDGSDRAGFDLGAVDPTSRATASVTLSVDGHGRRILQLALEADGPQHGLRHAWLVRHDDPSRRELLGMLDGPFGVWTIDQSLDLGLWSVLEVSQRAEDGVGDEALVRGDLAAIS